MSSKAVVLILILMTVIIPGGYGAGALITGRSVAQNNITVSRQNALLMYHKGQEYLQLQAVCKGYASRFVWLVPTPSVPDFRTPYDPDWRGKSSIYTTLENMGCDGENCIRNGGRFFDFWFDSNWILENWWLDPEDRILVGMCGSVPYVGYVEDTHPYVPEKRLGGDYHVSILRPKNQMELMKWLSSSGYTAPLELSGILTDYIRRGWVFTAIQVDAFKGAGDEKNGLLAPSIELSFPASEPVYPLSLSSSNTENVDIVLYAFSDSRLDTPLLHMEYSIGDAVGADAFVFVPPYKTPLSTLLVPGRMTKYTANLRPEEMTRDIVFKPSAKNEIVPIQWPHTPFLVNVGMLSMAVFAVFVSYPVYIIISVILFIPVWIPSERQNRRAWIRAWLFWTIFAVLFTRQGPLWMLFFPYLNDAMFYRIVGLISLACMSVLIATFVHRNKSAVRTR